MILSYTLAYSQFYEKAGVRNASMGETGIASTNNATASLWNPALLAGLHKIEINSDNRKYFWDLDNDELCYNFVAFSFPLGNIGTFAFSGGQFDANIYKESKLGFHFGNSFFNNKLSIGSSVYYYDISYGQNEYTINDPFFENFGYSSQAFDLDLGIAFKLNNKIRLGFVSKNIFEANLALDEQNDENLFRNYGFGIEWQISKKLLAATDVMLITNNPLQEKELNFATGFEYKLNKFLDLRSGVNKEKVTGGFGINILNKEDERKFHDPLSGKNFINIKSLQIKFNYGFQYSFSGIETQYGDHFIGVEIKFGSSNDKVNKLSDRVPPRTVSVTEIKTDNLSKQKVKVDSLEFEEKALIDTVFLTDTVYVATKDTVLIFSGIPNSKYIKKVEELNSLKDKYKQIRNSNRAQDHLLNSLEMYYRGNYEGAIKECKAAIRIAPDITISYIRLGSIYLKMNELERAKFYWRKAKQMDPNNPEIKKFNKYLK